MGALKKAHLAAGIDSPEGSLGEFLKLSYLPHDIRTRKVSALRCTYVCWHRNKIDLITCVVEGVEPSVLPS